MPGPTPSPLFIDGPAGRLFAVFHANGSDSGGNGEAVLYLPPFAEEMNRSRRMAALQARHLAAKGVGFLVLDPYGTGDSAGDFADARWETWRDDASSALRWLRERGFRRLSLLGLRLGACLALDVASQAQNDLARVVLWQPVLRGAGFLNQFLRIRLATGFTSPERTRQETTEALRQRLAKGDTLEVAGYPLAPDLARAIDALSVTELGLKCPTAIDWFELTEATGSPLSPAGAAVVKRLGDAGTAISACAVPGAQFWTIEETTVVPALLNATTDLLAEPPR